ncbi:MAG: ABC transporter permease [Halanaerobiales bacterium]|nr:ABC transporter permease [Halanaerobiales bacterium]
MFNVFFAVAKKEILTQLRYPLGLFFNIVVPFFLLIPLLLVVKAFGATDSYLWVIIGTVAWAWLSHIVWSVGLALRSEQQRGTMEQIAMAPTSIIKVMIGKSFLSLTINAFLLIVSGIVIAVVFKVNTDWVLVLINFIIMMPFMYGIAFLLAGMVLNFGEVFALFQVIMLIFVILCGITQPIEQLPGVFAMIGNVIPITWGISLLREIIMHNLGWESALPIMVKILVSGLILNLISILFLKALEERSKRDGGGLYGY